MSTTSNNQNNSPSPVRVDYSKYVADITGSPKATRQSTTTGIGHHINPLHNPYPNRSNQPAQVQQQQQGGMPQYGGGSEKCARCSKTVYLAEKKVGAGRSFHTSCFSCNTCHRKLDSTALSEHKGEIYCKSCYTKQFGAHGLISGVTMSTEQSASRDRSPRRPSYGSDLDTPGVYQQPMRERTYSSENIVHDNYGINRNNQSPKKYPEHTDRSPEQNSPTKKNTEGVNAVVERNYQRSPSPSRTLDSNTNEDDHRHRSTYFEEGDRSKYVYEGEKMSYGTGTSAVVNIPIVSQTRQPNSTTDQRDIPIEVTKDYQRSSSRSSSIASAVVDVPVVSPTKQSNSTTDRRDIPIEFSKDYQRSGSRSPSITSSDSYRRQNSRERQTDFTDDYSRLNINEDYNRNNRKSSTDNTMDILPSVNPLASSNETRYRETTSNSNNSDRGQYHSREPSPSSDFVSSSTVRTTSTTYRAGPVQDSSSTHTSQYTYRNNDVSSNLGFNTGRSPSPATSDRSSTGLTDFVSKTNLAGNVSTPIRNQNSTLGALAAGFRPLSRPDDDDN